MSQMLTVVDVSDVVPGKLGELKDAIGSLAGFVEANEPRPLAYQVFLGDDGSQMTVAQIHPDSASLELHMEVAAPAFAGFQDLVQLRTVDVYGAPSPAVLDALHAKASLLGDATVRVHDLHAGFTRFGR